MGQADAPAAGEGGRLIVEEGLAAAGFVAGMTTRAMGNMADAANRAAALEKSGLGAWPAYSLKQVHGKEIRDLDNASAAPADGDGWIVDAPGRVALVYAADCMPLFVWGAGGQAAGVLHSGWKGTKANIAAEGVKALRKRGIEPSGMRAAIGPHIGPCCYAVGDDFTKHFRAESLERRGGKLYFDLGAEARAQLIAAGLPGDGIFCSPACTACSGEFFSFRREKQGTRMMAFLAKRHDL